MLFWIIQKRKLKKIEKKNEVSVPVKKNESCLVNRFI